MAGSVLLQPAPGAAVCWHRPPHAVVAAGLDRPPLCPLSQRPVAKGRVEPVFPTAQPLLGAVLRDAVMLRVTLASARQPHLPQGRLRTRQLF